MAEQNLIDRIENLTHDYASGNDCESLRSDLQDIFDITADLDGEDYRDENSALAVKRALLLLRKICNSKAASGCKEYCCDVTELADTLSFCCDIMAAEIGKRLFFLPDRNVKTLCNPREFSWSLLNILINAVMYSDEKYISVVQKTNSENVMFSVESGGDFAIADFMEALGNETGGLACANRFITDAGGIMLMKSADGISNVSFTIPICEEDGKPIYAVPSVEELLYDRLSIVYVALCELM